MQLMMLVYVLHHNMDIQEVVKILLENKANIHAEDDDSLRDASYYGHTKVVKVLIENKANIHALDDYSLCFASENGHTEVVKVLLENKADIHAEDDETLRYASKNEHTEVVKVLLEAGADINKLDDNFINKYMIVSSDNISYLLQLDKIINLSEVKRFNYNYFIDAKSEIQSSINIILGKYVGSITIQYI